MKKSFLPLCLCSLAMMGCGQPQPSSSGSQIDEPLEEALSQLKAGFHAVLDFRATYQGNALAYGSEIVLNDDTFAIKPMTVGATGSLIDAGDFSYFGKEEDSGLLYQERINKKNEIYGDVRGLGGTYFEAMYYNPFETIDSSDLTKKEEGVYLLPQGFARSLPQWFGISISAFANVKFSHQELVLGEDGFKSLLIQTEDKKCKFGLSFSETGSKSHYEKLFPCEGDGTDKSALKASFDLLQNQNMTISYKMAPGSLNLVTGEGYIFYLDGENIFIDTNTYYAVPGLGEGDFYLKKEEAGLHPYRYSQSKSAFEDASSSFSWSLSYEDYLPKVDDIDMTLYQTKGSKFSCQVPIAVFSSFFPSSLTSDLIVMAAVSSEAEITESGTPKITQMAFYSMDGWGEEDSFGENVTFTSTYNNLGSTSLPESVLNATIL